MACVLYDLVTTFNDLLKLLEFPLCRFINVVSSGQCHECRSFSFCQFASSVSLFTAEVGFRRNAVSMIVDAIVNRE